MYLYRKWAKISYWMRDKVAVCVGPRGGKLCFKVSVCCTSLCVVRDRLEIDFTCTMTGKRS